MAVKGTVVLGHSVIDPPIQRPWVSLPGALLFGALPRRCQADKKKPLTGKATVRGSALRSCGGLGILSTEINSGQGVDRCPALGHKRATVYEAGISAMSAVAATGQETQGPARPRPGSQPMHSREAGQAAVIGGAR